MLNPDITFHLAMIGLDLVAIFGSLASAGFAVLYLVHRTRNMKIAATLISVLTAGCIWLRHYLG
jgi:hypothetical protein